MLKEDLSKALPKGSSLQMLVSTHPDSPWI